MEVPKGLLMDAPEDEQTVDIEEHHHQRSRHRNRKHHKRNQREQTNDFRRRSCDPATPAHHH
jgi:hypothetical protein